MSFTVPTFDEIRSALLRDIRNLLPESDVLPDSDFYARASSVASAVEGLYQHQAWICRQIFPDTADSEYLEWHASERGLSRKAASYAAGTMTIAGTAGTIVASGMAGTIGGTVGVETSASTTIGSGGTAVVAITATTAGTDGNVDAGTTVTLTSPPSGVDSTATIVTLSGAIDAEKDAELLDRLLDLLRHPPAGGNKYDYRRWARSISGVSDAYVYPLRRGLGTVDVAIVARDGLPSTATIASVQSYIDSMRPVAIDSCLVLAPTIKTVDITAAVTLDGSSTRASVASDANTVLAEYFDTLGPGDSAVSVKLASLMLDVSGVSDVQLSAPAANVSATVDATKVQWLRLGTVTITEAA